MNSSKRIKNYLNNINDLVDQMDDSLASSHIANLAWEAEQLAGIVKEILSDLQEDC